MTHTQNYFFVIVAPTVILPIWIWLLLPAAKLTWYCVNNYFSKKNIVLHPQIIPKNIFLMIQTVCNMLRYSTLTLLNFVIWNLT